MVAFKRPSKSRTSTGAVEKKFVELEYKTIGESVDDTKVALASVIELKTYILTGVDNTYRVVVKGKEYEILSTVEVNRRFMVITAKML